MRAAIFRGAFNIQVEQIPDATILEPTDAVVRITHACICGTDLWPYRGQGPYTPGWQIGHEWMGIVEDIGSEVRTLKRGDRVIASYDFCDGTCEFCRKGLDSACLQGGLWGYGHEGGQAEAIRARFADATLVALPSAVEGDEALLRALLPRSEEHTSELQSHSDLVCRLLLEKKKYAADKGTAPQLLPDPQHLIVHHHESG